MRHTIRSSPALIALVLLACSDPDRPFDSGVDGGRDTGADAARDGARDTGVRDAITDSPVVDAGIDAVEPGDGSVGEDANVTDAAMDSGTGTTVPSLTVGSSHACAVGDNGVARCWGENAYGQLGDGTVETRTAPVSVMGLTGVAAISAGTGFTCARMNDGTGRCWGANSSKQGSATSTGTCTVMGSMSACNLTPQPLFDLTGIQEIALGGGFGCARVEGGPARCWGSNLYGQRGDGTTTARDDVGTVLRSSSTLQLALGSVHACALLFDGKVMCWGRNANGQLGNGMSGTGADRSIAVDVQGITTAVQIAAGESHNCAVLMDGSVRCWGRNQFGQLGNNSTTNSSTPVLVAGVSNAVQVAAGAGHTCARLMDGSVMCWGNNADGQLGVAPGAARPTAAVVTSLTGATDLRLGGASTCIRRADGSAHCLGDNAHGQLGDGTTTDRTDAVRVNL